jgi:hypothetical protein
MLKLNLTKSLSITTENASLRVAKNVLEKIVAEPNRLLENPYCQSSRRFSYLIEKMFIDI